MHIKVRLPKPDLYVHKKTEYIDFNNINNRYLQLINAVLV